MFTGRSVRSYIDDASGTRWCNLVLIKTNVLLWWNLLNRHPIRENLVHRGVDVHTGPFPSYDLYSKDIGHVFLGCEVAD